MAGDPMCVTILVGLGYRHLSMNGRSVARVKYLLRRIDIEEAQELSRRSLEAQMTAEVRHGGGLYGASRSRRPDPRRAVAIARVRRKP